MNKNSVDPRSILLKAVCTFLALILGGSLFAAGVMGSDGCGMKCCCQASPTHMQPAAEQQMRSTMDCCSGNPLRPCDIKSAQPFELPEIILAAACGDIPSANGPTIILSDSHDNRLNPGCNFISQILDPKFNSPPLYLQKLSFLI